MEIVYSPSPPITTSNHQEPFTNPKSTMNGTFDISKFYGGAWRSQRGARRICHTFVLNVDAAGWANEGCGHASMGFMVEKKN